MSTFRQDLRGALRVHGRGRIVTLLAILSLALGIAGNAVVFSLISSTMIRPLPYPEPERLVLLTEREHGHVAVSISVASMRSSLSTYDD
jgi:putative ABC transport system permease protein